MSFKIGSHYILLLYILITIHDNYKNYALSLKHHHISVDFDIKYVILLYET
jgi:hypothetical protein